MKVPAEQNRSEDRECGGETVGEPAPGVLPAVLLEEEHQKRRQQHHARRPSQRGHQADDPSE
jgi:hypothetical protein